MSFRSGRFSAPLGALLTLCIGSTAYAIDAEGARAEAQREIQNVQKDMAALESKLEADQRPTHPPEELIAAGDMSLRTKDYENAIDTFNQVVELHRQGKAGVNAHADGLFLLGEAYFEAGQLLSARRQHDLRTGLRQQACKAGAEPARCTGYQRDPA